MADITSKVKEIIVDKLGVDAAEVTPEASFTKDLGADSLDTVELIMEFEKAFEIAEDKDIKLACAEYLKNIYFRFREKGAEFQANHEKYNRYVEENK